MTRTTIDNNNYYTKHMQRETDIVLNGSDTPFKDTVSNIFQTTSNTFAILSNATGVGRIQSKEWLVNACHEANMQAVKHDEKNYTSALLAKLEAQEIENAILRSKQPGQTEVQA